MNWLEAAYKTETARVTAVKALRKAERSSAKREANECLWRKAKTAADNYEIAANRWKDEAKSFEKSDPLYYQAAREAEYAEGYTEKIKKLYDELVKKGDKYKTKRRIHLMHSSKGGCGKSFNSITYAMYLSQKYAYGETDGEPREGFTEDNNRVLLIDCDFRGAGVETQFLNTFNLPIYELEEGRETYCGTYEELRSPRPMESRGPGNMPAYLHEDEKQRLVTDGRFLCVKKAPEYFNRCMMRNDTPSINACISQMRMYRKLSDEYKLLAAHTNLEEKRELRIGFDVMFSDSSPDAKRAFLANSSRVDGSIVNCSYFKRSFKEMMKQLKDERPNYTDIIIDMSPGTDEYVDCIIDAVLHEDFAQDDHVVLHAITTSDIAHMKAMEEYLVNIIANRSQRFFDFGEIRLIINEIRRYYWDGKHDVITPGGSRTKHGDPGGRKGIANAETIAKDIITRINARMNKPFGWIEVYSRLFLEEYRFDNLNVDIPKGESKKSYKHPITETLLALFEQCDPNRELELRHGSGAERVRRFDLPLLFWPLNDQGCTIDPNAPLEAIS